jgi:phosphoglucomutase
MGAAVPEGDDYRLLTGNEMGLLLFDYICQKRIANGTMPKDPVAVTTIVSTDLADRVAEKYGVTLHRVLTGFKFIGEQIGLLEKQGEAERFIFGFEESYGYLSGSHVRDKDAVNATMLCCEMAAWYKEKGMTLAEAMQELYHTYGFNVSELSSFSFEGAEGMETMTALMEQLRKNPPTKLCGLEVKEVLDYQKGIHGLPQSNVLSFLADDRKVLVRPSGTEPKMKLYLSADGASLEEAAQKTKALLKELTEQYF